MQLVYGSRRGEVFSFRGWSAHLQTLLGLRFLSSGKVRLRSCHHQRVEWRVLGAGEGQETCQARCGKPGRKESCQAAGLCPPRGPEGLVEWMTHQLLLLSSLLSSSCPFAPREGPLRQLLITLSHGEACDQPTNQPTSPILWTLHFCCYLQHLLTPGPFRLSSVQKRFRRSVGVLFIRLK